MSQYLEFLRYSVYSCAAVSFIMYASTVKILNIGTCMSEQTVQILIRLLLRSSLIRIYTVCHSFYIFWRHYFIVKLNCFILRTTTVAGLDVPIFRVFTIFHCYECLGNYFSLSKNVAVKNSIIKFVFGNQ